MAGFGKRGLVFGVMLVAGVTLSACQSVDNMFDDNSAPGPAPAHMVRVTPRDAVKARAARCDTITDERRWLDCYYGAAQPVRAELGLPSAPQSQQALVPAGP